MARHTFLHRDHVDDRTDADTGDATGLDDGTATRPYEVGERRVVDRDELIESDEVAAHRRDVEAGRRAAVHDTYGGMSWGACFFGWLVAVGVTVLLAAILSAVATAVGANLDWTRADAEARAGSIGLAAAVALAVVMFVGYYAGGYVAGRMARVDAARQGLGVWFIGLVALLVAAAAGALLGTRFDIAGQIDLPSVDLSSDQIGWGAAVTGVVLLIVMLLGALLGSAVSRRYHAKIDRASTGS